METKQYRTVYQLDPVYVFAPSEEVALEIARELNNSDRFVGLKRSGYRGKFIGGSYQVAYVDIRSEVGHMTGFAVIGRLA